MTIALSAIRPLVATSVPGAPYPLIDDAIRRGARELVKATHCIVEDVPVPTVATQSDYVPTLTAATEILAVESVRRAPSLAPTAGTPLLFARDLTWMELQGLKDDTPNFFALTEDYPVLLRLYPTPVAVETLTAKFVVMPTKIATVIDSRLGDWYLEAIIAYAKYWMMNMSNVQWANEKEAMSAYQQFISWSGDVTIRRKQGRVNLGLHVQMRPRA